jgi:hypothetical protein
MTIYLLWSNKYGAWWRPDAWGYTERVEEAGRYTESEATSYVIQSAQCGLLSGVTCMVAAPENGETHADDPATQPANGAPSS